MEIDDWYIHRLLSVTLFGEALTVHILERVCAQKFRAVRACEKAFAAVHADLKLFLDY